MSFYLYTESHGDVESGFYSAFTQLSRLGKYVFSTKSLVDLFKHLAKNPEVREAQLLAYDERIFWDRTEEFIDSLVETIFETHGQKAKERNETIDARLTQSIAEGAQRDSVELPIQGEQVNVVISQDGGIIQIGEYTISREHFGSYAWYVTKGGIYGWTRVPDFAKGAKRALRYSKHPLYSSLRTELEESRRHKR